ncbi:SGNH/GDSL hydrolase family protein [Streptacidiphilus monticola]|uniref:SGNH/GDSL hydrolase family protein n=1 Tax=Streptacidiphilus monticola TaxID=2161674 RepID=A0ABW1FV00_9ACTN
MELRRAKTAGLIAGVLAGTVALGGCQAAQVTRSQDGGPGAPVRVTGPYVALGDSYTAGPRIPDATGTPVGCLRSDANYPHLVAKALGLSGSTQFRDVSCSSARVADLTRPQKTADGTNPPQLDALNSATRLVTVGIGGNDVGFASLLGACVQAGLEYQLSAGGRNAAHGVAPCQAEYTSSGADEIAARITKAGGKVAALLAQVRERAPHARVFVVGYPAILSEGDPGSCTGTLGLTAGDTLYLAAEEEALNARLQQVATAAGARFVDTYTASATHSACTDAQTRWVEPLFPASPAAPAHPNARGEAALAAAVLKAMRSPR